MALSTGTRVHRDRFFVAGLLCVAIAAAAYGTLHVLRGPRPVGIHVRWAPDVDDFGRQVAERRYSLSQGALLDGRTWDYTLSDPSRANVSALVGDPAVEDTQDIDRTTFRVSPSAPRRPFPPASRPLTLAGLWGLTLLGLFFGVTCIGLGVMRRAGDDVPTHQRRTPAIAIAATAPVLLAVAFLTGSTPDEEEFRWGILSSFLHLRALGQGTFGTWTSTLGFGIPQPMVPNFDMHPLVPLLAVVSPATWARLVLVAHTLLGAVGMWQLGRMLRLTPLVRAVCVFTFLLATPTQNYTLSDFWPSHYVMWTSAPWLLLLTFRVLEATGRDVGRYSATLGVCAGVVLAATHPGHAPVYGVVVLAVMVGQWRAVLARWRWLLVAALITLAIGSPGLTQLATERQIFDPDLGIVKNPQPLPPSAVRDVFLRPFSLSERPWQAGVLDGGTRTLFFGGPFAVLGLLGAIRLGRSYPTLAIGVALSSVLLFTPLVSMTFLSRFHIRDPLLLCAIPLAGLAADHLLRLPRAHLATLFLLAAQVGIVAAAALPFFDDVWQPGGRQAFWFRGASAETQVTDDLLALMSAPGRLAYSPQIEYEVSEGGGVARLREGLGVNALAFRSVPVINGSFKGISTDLLWPDDRLFYGRIRLPRPLVASDEELDLLGIRYVLANPGEVLAPGLHERGSVRKSDGLPILLYENVDAGPGAFVVAAQPRELPLLQLYPGCSNDRFLCKDLTPLARLRRLDRLEITRSGSRIEVNVEAGSTPRILVIAEMFRREWAATSNGRSVETLSVGPGLLGVILPTDRASIRLDYHAPMLVATSVLAWGALAIGLAIVFSRSRRNASVG